MRRVAITGAGAICALGRNTAEFAASLRAGRLAASGRSNRPTCAQFRFQNGAEVKGYCHQPYFDDRRADFMDRFAQFAVIAAREAVEERGRRVDPGTARKRRHRDRLLRGRAEHGRHRLPGGLQAGRSNRVHPLTIPKTMANAGASHISMEFGITGPSFTISTACSSSGHAIGQAFWMVRSGMTDLAITGGSEAPFSFGILKAWEAMRVVSPDTCRPFSKDRRGMILGEGAAMFVLEPLEAAVARGARDSRRDRGLRHVGGRLPHHPAFVGGRGPGHARRAARCRYRARTDRLHQRARHRHARQRPHRDRGHPRGLRRACAKGCR